MIRRFAAVAVLTAVMAACATSPARADDPPAKTDPTADLLAKLRKPVELDLRGDVPLTQLAEFVSDKYGVRVLINGAAFIAAGEDATTMQVHMTGVKGLPLGTALRHGLEDKAATFLVRRGHIELVPVAFAAKEAKIPPAAGEDTPQLTVPLVSAIYREKPLNEAVADLAEEHDLTVVVAPRAGDAKTAFVSARLLNVPADKALELLALQADLRVLKKGNTFFITGKDHADELFNEKLDRERQKIEVERMRVAPFGPQQPGFCGGLGGLGGVAPGLNK